MKQKLAWILIALLALSLAATSLVTARNFVTQDVMVSPFVSLPEGSKHPTYDGDYVYGNATISLTSGWSTNLPYNTCAIAARLAFKDNQVERYAALRPGTGQVYAIQTLTQVVNRWNSSGGIVPINTYPPTVLLEINSAGYVYMELLGYWVCDDYAPAPRPTLAP